MIPQFQPISQFPRGTLYNLLSAAYAFDDQWAQAFAADWRDFDDFFYDNVEIADRCGFITTVDDRAVGFASWDPRHLPEWVQVGHNCIHPDYKGQGLGAAQMTEAVRRIQLRQPRRIIVTTNARLVPAQHMYQRAGFQLIGHRDNPSDSAFSGAYWDYEMVCGD